MTGEQIDPFEDSDDPFDRHMDDLVGYLDDLHRDTKDSSPPGFRAGFEFARHLVRDYHLSYSEAVQCECDDGFGAYEEMTGGRWVCADCGTAVLSDDEPVEFEPPDEGEIQSDHPFNQEQVLYSDEFAVEYIPTKTAFTLRVFDDDGVHHLVGRASIDDYLDSLEESSVPEEFIDAIETGENMVSSGAIADLVGPDLIRSLNEGTITTEEFMEEFSAKADRYFDSGHDEG